MWLVEGGGGPQDGRSIGLVGRQTMATNHPKLRLGAILGRLVLTPWGLAYLEWSEYSSWATLGPFDPESAL